MSVQTKVCTHCHESKPATSEYFYSSKYKDGFKPECKACVKLRNDRWRAQNPDKKRAQNKRRYQRDPEHCRAIAKHGTAKYRKAHPERIKEYVRRYKETHLEEIRARSRAYYHSHPKRDRREYLKQYRATHPPDPERSRYHWNKRQAKKKALPATLTPAEWQETLKYFDHRCAYCGRRRKLEQEHVIPVSKGGGYTKANIVPSCLTCNRKKHAHTPDEIGMVIRKPWPLTNLQMDQAA